MDMAQLTISEEWIRKKLNITHDNLEDIKALSLAGTYQEKICFLGNALHKFTRLKELDLSRNSLVSLEGLENCKQLEKLNLYYNNISSLKELERLRFNSVLCELDLRLNPITKEENDYRLYLIHILPSLRVFDDRSIRDSERQMALTYFDQKNNLISSSVSSTLSSVSITSTPSSSVSSSDSKPPPPMSSNNPRVKAVNNLVKRSAGICSVDSDETKTNYTSNMLNLRMHNEDYYSNQDTNSMSNFESNSYQTLNCQQDSSYFNKSKSCSMQNLRALESQQLQQQQHQQQANNKSKSVHFNEVASYHDLNSYRSSSDNNLNAYDESDAFNNFKSRGSFTPNPSFYNEMNGQSQQQHHQQKNKKQLSRDAIESDGSNNSNDYKTNQLFLLLDLVDRYWNGSKSLHQNQKFLTAAVQLVSNEDASSSSSPSLNSDLITSLQAQLRHAQEENKRLQAQLQTQKSSTQSESLSELQHKNLLAEFDIVKKKLIQTQEENKKLQKELSEKSEKLQMEAFESQNGTLKREIEIMRIKLKQYEQLQQLTGMLQESHKSLVTTNEHLLQEISNHKRQQLRLNTANIYSNSNSTNDLNLYSPTQLAQQQQQQQQQQQLQQTSSAAYSNGVPKSNGTSHSTNGNKTANARFSYSVK